MLTPCVTTYVVDPPTDAGQSSQPTAASSTTPVRRAVRRAVVITGSSAGTPGGAVDPPHPGTRSGVLLDDGQADAGEGVDARRVGGGALERHARAVPRRVDGAAVGRVDGPGGRLQRHRRRLRGDVGPDREGDV